MQFVRDTDFSSHAQFVVGAPRQSDILSTALKTAYLPEPDYSTEIDRLLEALDCVASIPERATLRNDGRD